MPEYDKRALELEELQLFSGGHKAGFKSVIFIFRVQMSLDLGSWRHFLFFFEGGLLQIY